MPKKLRCPSYTLHKPSGRGRTRIDGRDIYFAGLYGSAESRAEYDALIAKWLARKDPTRVTLTVADLCVLYLEHAEKHYRKNGKSTSEVHCIRSALRHAIKVHGRTHARAFGPKALKAARKSMIEAGFVRSSINIHVGRIRAMFRWAVAEELVPGAVLVELQAVTGLRSGRSDAVESEPVKPVAHAAIDAVRPYVSPPVWAMIQVQLLTGMRPGEVLVMRGCDLNTSRQGSLGGRGQPGSGVYDGLGRRAGYRLLLRSSHRRTDLDALLSMPDDRAMARPACHADGRGRGGLHARAVGTAQCLGRC